MDVNCLAMGTSNATPVRVAKQAYIDNPWLKSWEKSPFYKKPEPVRVG